MIKKSVSILSVFCASLLSAIIVSASFFPVSASAQNISPNLEPATQAFSFFAHLTYVNKKPVIEATWGADDGYHLYHDKFFFASKNGVMLGTPVIPAGQVVFNKGLGANMEEHTGIVKITIPVVSMPANQKSFTLLTMAQGCADVGVCYPPQKRETVIKVQ
jgi:thiol:disulfide interchange protein DsbD